MFLATFIVKKINKGDVRSFWLIIKFSFLSKRWTETLYRRRLRRMLRNSSISIVLSQIIKKDMIILQTRSMRCQNCTVYFFLNIRRYFLFFTCDMWTIFVLQEIARNCLETINRYSISSSNKVLLTSLHPLS